MSGCDIRRLRLDVRGAVQGVGFRPTVYRLATELGLTGWVINDVRGVAIEIEGQPARLETFVALLRTGAPPRAAIESVQRAWVDPEGAQRFEIRHSDPGGDKTTIVLPDMATCPDCLGEVLDAADRRHGYPFTNCTNCGPRFTIVRELPYDRPNTTMRRFTQCAHCQREYDDPLDRRFHAQPNACPECGPRLALWDPSGRTLAEGADALERAARAVERGEILALKGLGGFHLVVDAGDDVAVARLRERKRRRDKPLALMIESVDAARALCTIDEEEERQLASPEAPIVLLRRRGSHDAGTRDAGRDVRPPALRESQDLQTGSYVRGEAPDVPHSGVTSRDGEFRFDDEGRPVSSDGGRRVAEGIAPGNPWLGVMLPYTPLHHLLMRRLARPVVATSGNLTDEPICIDETEAAERLGSIADLFLVHDRPIARHADDSIVAVSGGRPTILRRARGLAPLPVLVARDLPTIVAVGAHLKNAVALGIGRRVFVSQHIGDMDTPQALAAFEGVIDDFLRLYEAAPVALAADLHPDYPTTRWAEVVVQTSAGIAGASAAGHADAAARAAGDGVDGSASRGSSGARRPAFPTERDGVPTASADDARRGLEAELFDADPRSAEPARLAEFSRVRELAARLGGLPIVRVQHHHAHLASCLADNDEEGPALGVTWDGTGYGADGTVWGGEFLLGDAPSFERVAALRPFRLIGGDAAVREPRRSAFALLCDVLGEQALARDDLAPVAALTSEERSLFAKMLESGLRSPLTTSAGRLFDAISSLAGLRQRASFEGQAAMELEFAADPAESRAYPLPVVESGGDDQLGSAGASPRVGGARQSSADAPRTAAAGTARSGPRPEPRHEDARAHGADAPTLLLDWRPLVEAVVADVVRGVPPSTVAARFHAALADAIADVARRVGAPKVALTGGCFQNRTLTALAVRRLDSAGLRVLLHRQVPPNDGGISLGQVAIAAARLEAGAASR